MLFARVTQTLLQTVLVEMADSWLQMHRFAYVRRGNLRTHRGIVGHMSDVTQILCRIEAGDPEAADQLLPLVYAELRKLAVLRMAQEKPGQTIQATALVHEAYLRLVDREDAQQWDSRGHFFRSG